LRAVIAVTLPLEQLQALNLDSTNMLIDALEPIVNDAERVFGDKPHVMAFLFRRLTERRLTELDVDPKIRKEWNLRRRDEKKAGLWPDSERGGGQE
jgi:hypothetical protein